MSRHRISTNEVSRLAVAVLWAIGGSLRADNPPAAPDGYKAVPLQSGGYVLVQKENNPYAHAHSSSSSDKYRPDNMNFSLVSPMASQQFNATTSSVSKKDSLVNSQNQSAFVTKSYNEAPTSGHGVSNQDKKFNMPVSDAYAHNSNSFDKSYATSSSNLGSKQVAAFDKASSDQDQTATFKTHKTDTYASRYASQTYTGPEVEKIKSDLNKLNGGMMDIKDLPNRPLTIDEVRALINHGVKPDTSAPPPPASKALNDPDYKPDETSSLVPKELPAPVNEDDKNDPVPAPGTMAHPPENSEPLPQR